MDWSIIEKYIMASHAYTLLFNSCSFASDSKVTQKWQMLSLCLDSRSSQYALFWTKRLKPTSHVGSALWISFCDLYLGIFFQFFLNKLADGQNELERRPCVYSLLWLFNHCSLASDSKCMKPRPMLSLCLGLNSLQQARFWIKISNLTENVFMLSGSPFAFFILRSLLYFLK
jgi:hypothetical protein